MVIIVKFSMYSSIVFHLGTLMELGISPIVTSGLIMQVSSLNIESPSFWNLTWFLGTQFPSLNTFTAVSFLCSLHTVNLNDCYFFINMDEIEKFTFLLNSCLLVQNSLKLGILHETELSLMVHRNVSSFLHVPTNQSHEQCVTTYNNCTQVFCVIVFLELAAHPVTVING